MLSIQKSIPRWGILVVDLLITLISLLFSFILRFNFSTSPSTYYNYSNVFVLYFVIRLIGFIAFKQYASILTYTSTNDVFKIFTSLLWTTLAIILINSVTFSFTNKFLLPNSVIIIEFILTLLIMAAFRIVVKSVYLKLINSKKEKKRVLICGVGEEAIITKKTLERDPSINYKITGFLMIDKRLKSKKIEGISIYHSIRHLGTTLKKTNPDILIFTNNKIPYQCKRSIINHCIRRKIKILNIPPMYSWVNGEFSPRQLKHVGTTELLSRDPIKLDIGQIHKYLNHKTIIVTGAAGSIGSEIVRQVCAFQPKCIIAIDQAETPLHNLRLEMEKIHPKISIKYVLCNIRILNQLETIFYKHRPNVIFHAAAYKHVPLMESNPKQAVETNIIGTKNLVDLSINFKVKSFVYISTDKAVNPTNVMGASKRIAELYVQSADQIQYNDTKFITTRFGNVLGSNGSVVPLFKSQIKNGGPITVTHPDIVRYFMTIGEACQLVLEAGCLGQGGEIYVFDMGEPVKIVDLARKLIMESGFTLGKDIDIKFTGLRPGEKLYEELLNDKEKTIQTHHPKILIAKVMPHDFESVNAQIVKLQDAIENNISDRVIVKKMKNILPEFISNNSNFIELDSL